MTGWAERYLELLGIDVKTPTLDGLRAITSAHPRRVPFENISAILRRRDHGPGAVPPLDLEAMLDAWCARRGGGVCFEVVAMVDRLLAELGYWTRPVLAQISFPGSHQANLVDIGGRRYLVDVGNGAPFLEPIPLDGEFEIQHAGLRFRFHPALDANLWLQDRWIDGAWQPFCRYPLDPPDPAVREAAYQEHHTLGQSWVVDALVLSISAHDEVWSLRDRELRHFTVDGKTVERLSDATDYAALAAAPFEIPRLPIDEARAALQARRATT